LLGPIVGWLVVFGVMESSCYCRFVPVLGLLPVQKQGALDAI
jgi:hypothetical protein